LAYWDEACPSASGWSTRDIPGRATDAVTFLEAFHAPCASIRSRASAARPHGRVCVVTDAHDTVTPAALVVKAFPAASVVRSTKLAHSSTDGARACLRAVGAGR